jgi:hypothetical protein
MTCDCKDCEFSALICLRHATKDPKKKFVEETETCEFGRRYKWKDALMKKDESK